MKTIVAILLLSSIPLAAAGQPAPASVKASEGSSANILGWRALDPGAVYERKIRLRPDRLSQYLRFYSRFYSPVDQYICDMGRYGDHCESSGRKLVSALSREHGDEYNLAMVYRYEDAYKRDYYCKYTKAFIQHLAKVWSSGDGKADRELSDLAGQEDFIKDMQSRIDDALAEGRSEGGKGGDLDTLAKALPARCAAVAYGAKPVALERAMDIVNLFDQSLALNVEADEGSWYHPINVCRIEALAEKTTDKEALKLRCPETSESVLQRAMDLEWSANWSPKGKP